MLLSFSPLWRVVGKYRKAVEADTGSTVARQVGQGEISARLLLPSAAQEWLEWLVR